MKERPLLFTPANAGLVFTKKKTQTRRVVKPQPRLCRTASPAQSFAKVEPGDLFICPDLFPTEIPPGPVGSVITECESVGIFHCMGVQQFVEKHGPKAYGIVGDRLWIRESHCLLYGSEGDDDIVCYRADKSIRVVHCREENGKLIEWVNSEPDQENCADDYRDSVNDKWRSAMFMPRYACRTVVEITDVRVERLQDISEEDIAAEGVKIPPPYVGVSPDGSPIESAHIDKDPWWWWQQLWDSINGESEEKSWRGNPLVWVITFQKLD